jgi:hypothetical protein
LPKKEELLKKETRVSSSKKQKTKNKNQAGCSGTGL